MRTIDFARTLFVCLLGALAVFGQQFRGTILGRVVDAQEAVIPNASVTATKLDTGEVYATESTDTGQFTLSFLAPGQYRLEATAQGFKTYVREPVQVSSNQQMTLDIALEVGEIVETVTVSAEAPILVTSTASTGQVISSRQIANMPLNGRTPLSLAQLAFGVVPSSDPRFQRPFDNAGPSGFSMGGSPNRENELLLDGSPDTTRDKRVAYNPPVDTVQEVKVEAFQADAAYGNTGAGTVNVVLRGGTNDLHGAAYWFNQTSRFQANDFFANRAGRGKGRFNYNQWGITAGGPLLIPKVINGKNRVFWYFAYEGIKDRVPEPFQVTVPRENWRNGDFSDLLALGSSYTIYDPLSGSLQPDGKIRRNPFPNNVIPSGRISPIATNTLRFFPSPNQPGEADGRNNFQVNSARGDDFYNVLGRMDFNFSSRHKMFWNIRQNERTEFRDFAFGLENIANGNFLKRINWGATLDDVYTLSPTFILNTRLNWTRFTEGSARPSLGFDMTSLGFPQRLAAASSQAVFPAFDFNDFRDLGTSGSTPMPFDQYQIFVSATKIVGSHTMKFGTDLRLLREHGANFGNSSGRYEFRNNFTRGPFNTSGGAPLGQDLASMLLGLPTAGSFDVAAFRTNDAGYAAFFLQDDWRVNSELSLNLGIRYEKEVPTVERWDRQVVGFDGISANRITDAAVEAYAANPISELPVSQFSPAGGVIFARPGNRNVTETSNTNFSPRFGVAYSPRRLGGKTVFRAGFGIFFFTKGVMPSQQPGIRQTTPFVRSLDGDLTPFDTLDNPFRDGIKQPQAEGINTFLGQGVTFYNSDFKQPYSLRWNFSIQQQLTNDTVLEVGYMGNHAVGLDGTRDFNVIPRDQLSTQVFRDQANIDRLGRLVTNPFKGLLPGTSLNGSRISAEQLLRAHPHFNGDAGTRFQYDNFGGSYFHMFQARLEKRLSNGVQLMANYMFSKLIETRSFLNQQDFAPEKRIAGEDRPHRLVLSGMYELPFGRGKAIAGNAGTPLNYLIGGWTVNGIYTLTNGGFPGDWGNVIYLGGDLDWDGHRVDGTAFNTAAFITGSTSQPAQNLRTFPTRFTRYRADIINNIDVSVIKEIPIYERVNLQLRGEAFNAFNRPAFDGPNISPSSSSFGKITRQRNLPRVVQLALKLTW
mgnify:CR=1 FL=1